jgi:nucleotide-binding universal stress UspA family protein
MHPDKQRVICGTDFSVHAAEAADVAAAIARRLGEPVVLVHAIEVWAVSATYPEIYRELVAREQEHLSAEATLVPADAEARGIEIETELPEGPEVFRAIVQAGERFGADLICMSSHGGGGVAKAVLGSVTQSVMQHTHRPVLIVPPPLL